MNIVGHGIDIVEVDHFQQLSANGATDVLARYFTARELDTAGARQDQGERLAARFAAKEAVLKALGLGWSNDIAWTDVEIETLPSGAPSVVLHARCGDYAAQRGVATWLVSLSHTSAVAVASAIAVCGADPE